MGRLGFNSPASTGKTLTTFSGLHSSGVLAPPDEAFIAQLLYDYEAGDLFLDKIEEPAKLLPPISVGVPCLAYNGVDSCTEFGDIYSSDVSEKIGVWAQLEINSAETIISFGASIYRLYQIGGTFTLGATEDTGISTIPYRGAMHFYEVTVDGVDTITSFSIDGTEMWTGTAVGSSPSDADIFYVGCRPQATVKGLFLTGKVGTIYIDGNSIYPMTENPPLDIGLGSNHATSSTATESTADGIPDLRRLNGYTPPPLTTDALPEGVYGVEWDSTDPDPDVSRVVRIGSSTLHETLPVQSGMYACVLDDRGVEVYKLDPDDWSKKADGTASNLDGTDGQVMVRIPEYWFQNETDGVTERWLISGTEQVGYEHIPAQYMSAYEATVQRSTSKLSSVKSTDEDYRGGNDNATWDSEDRTLIGKPATSISRTNFRAYARNRGAGWEMYNYWSHRSIMVMFVTEYATRNSQASVNVSLSPEGYKQGGLGLGCVDLSSTLWGNWNSRNPFISCGYTDTLASGTGDVDFTMPSGYGVKVTRSNRYRGVENPFGHIWKNVDAVNLRIYANSEAIPISELMVAKDNTDWNDTNYTGYEKYGEFARSSGYGKSMINGQILPDSTSGSSSSTYWCDYFYTSLPPSGVSLRTVLFGGSAYHGSNAGLGYSYSDLSPSSASTNFGSRLCFIPEYSDGTYLTGNAEKSSGAVTITDTATDTLTVADIVATDTISGGDAVLGGELVTDYDFSQGGVGWITTSGWSIADEKLNCDGTAISSTTTTGTWPTGDYLITIDVASATSGGVRVSFSGGDSSPYRYTAGKFSYYLTNPSGDNRLFIGTDSFIGSVNSVSVIPILSGILPIADDGKITFAPSGIFSGPLFVDGVERFNLYSRTGLTDGTEPSLVDGAANGEWQVGAAGFDTMFGTRVVSGTAHDIAVDARDLLPIGVVGSRDRDLTANGSPSSRKQVDPWFALPENTPNRWHDGTDYIAEDWEATKAHQNGKYNSFIKSEKDTIGTQGICLAIEDVQYEMDHNLTPAGLIKANKYFTVCTDFADPLEQVTHLTEPVTDDGGAVIN